MTKRSPTKMKRSPAFDDHSGEKTFIQYRIVLIILASVGALCVYAMRVNMNVAIVSMVNHTAVRQETKDSDCKPSALYATSPSSSSTNATTTQEDGSFTWSPQTQGVILGAFFWGYIITPIPGGFLAERFGGKWLFGLGVVVTGVLGMLIPVVSINFGHQGLIGLRALQGFCEGVTYPALEALLAFWIPANERCAAITFVHQGGFAGVVIGMLLSGRLAAATGFFGGWPSIFYVFGTISIVWFVMWIMLTSDRPENHRYISEHERRRIRHGLVQRSKKIRALPWRSVFMSPPVWAYVATTFGFLYLQYTLITELPTYLGTILRFDVQSSGLYSALPYFGAIVTSALAAFASDYLVKHNVLQVTTVRKLFNSVAMFGSSIVLCLVVVVAGCDGFLSLTLFLIAGAIRGLAEASTGPVAIDMAPEFAGTIYGITVTVGSFSGVIVPYVTGLLTDEVNSTTNWSYSFYIAGAVGIVTGLIFQLFGSADLQPWAVNDGSQNESRPPGNDLSLTPVDTYPRALENL